MDETPNNIIAINGIKQLETTIENKPAKVIPIGGVTKLDLPPDRILEEAKGKLDGVVIIGFPKDGFGGQVYAASSYADGGEVLWLLEACKNLMMRSIDSIDDLDEE